MIYEQNCYNLNTRYFENLIEVNSRNIPYNFIKFRIYENVLQIFKLNKSKMIIKYYDKEFLVYSETDLKRIFKIL